MVDVTFNYDSLHYFSSFSFSIVTSIFKTSFYLRRWIVHNAFHWTCLHRPRRSNPVRRPTRSWRRRCFPPISSIEASSSLVATTFRCCCTTSRRTTSRPRGETKDPCSRPWQQLPWGRWCCWLTGTWWPGPSIQTFAIIIIENVDRYSIKSNAQLRNTILNYFLYNFNTYVIKHHNQMLI